MKGSVEPAELNLSVKTISTHKSHVHPSRRRPLRCRAPPHRGRLKGTLDCCSDVHCSCWRIRGDTADEVLSHIVRAVGVEPYEGSDEQEPAVRFNLAGTADSLSSDDQVPARVIP